MRKVALDYFAGLGGATEGMLNAGVVVHGCVNHCPIAVSSHAINHMIRHFKCDVFDVDATVALGGSVKYVRVHQAGRKITSRRRRIVERAGLACGLAWFSPDCRHFSCASGGAPVSPRVRSLAWVGVKVAKDEAPDTLMYENVREFLTWGPCRAKRHRNGRPMRDKMGRPLMEPIPERKGETFRRWVAAHKRLGYSVGWRLIDAASLGVPQHRRRLFVVCKRDGSEAKWPEPSHGPEGSGLKPYRTAAECIDWDLPCPSIFDRPGKPVGLDALAENTGVRLFKGFDRYVVNDADPYIVRIGQTGRGGHGVRSVRAPLSAVCTKAEHLLTLPVLLPHILHVNHSGDGFRGQRLDVPMHAVTRAHGQALIVPWLVKHYGGVVGTRIDRPFGTVTARDHHSVAVGWLSQFRGSNQGKGDLREPMPTITAGGHHVALTLAFLMKFYGTGGQWGRLDRPMGTIPTRDRFALVKVRLATGERTDAAAVFTRAFGWCIVLDILMRMLTPRELARAQGFPDSYILPAAKDRAVKLIGNSVCPAVVEALVRANCPEMCGVKA